MSAIPRIQDFDDPTYDPFIADEAMFGEMEDPYRLLAAARREAKVRPGDYRSFMGLQRDITFPPNSRHFMVLGYDEVAKVLGDPMTFSNAAYRFNIGQAFGDSISTMDAPQHSRFRPIFQKAFLPQIVAKWSESLVAPVVDNLIAKFAERGEADLIQEFTLYYPFHIIYRQLGLPKEDIETFHKLAIAQIVVSYDKEHGNEATRKLGEYFRHMLAARRLNPGEDIVSLLAKAEVDGDTLPENILVSFLRQLVNAGGDTTYRATSVLLTALLRDPAQLEAVRQNRELIPAAIEEALRWDGPVLMQTRMATCDTELGGVAIPAGSIMDVCAGSANRDESRFTDPDRFDIFRPKGPRHFSFTFGPHVCIGQHLARVEMTRALNTILDRLPNLRLNPDQPPPKIQGAMMRAPRHLHVRFDGAV